MKTFQVFLGAMMLMSSACGQDSSPGPNSNPASSAVVSMAASAASVSVDATKPTTLKRTKTPQDRRIADEKACENGDSAACRRAADRYRGYGHIAGCGLERKGIKPRRMVTAADSEEDQKGFDTWIRRLCDLGDEEACLQGRANLGTVPITTRTSHACARSGVGDCPLYQWATRMHPDKKKVIDDARRVFITSGSHGRLFVELFRKEKNRGGDVLPKEVAELATAICKETHECDEITLMLDENGYTPAAIAPVRKAFGEELARACLEGECVCGEAVRYLEQTDARIPDLAAMGCDDGEPDGCYALGDVHERGMGVSKDVGQALALYQVACPPMVADDQRADIVSQSACHRLSIKYDEGQDLEKDRDRAYFYSTLACPGEGVNIDHSYCVRRAVFHGKYDYLWRKMYRLTTYEIGQLIFRGPSNEPINEQECERPSVAALCKETAPLLAR